MNNNEGATVKEVIPMNNNEGATDSKEIPMNNNEGATDSVVIPINNNEGATDSEVIPLMNNNEGATDSVVIPINNNEGATDSEVIPMNNDEGATDSVVPMNNNEGAADSEAIPMNNNEGATDSEVIPLMNTNERATYAKESLSRIFSKFIAGFWNALGYVAPTVKRIYDIKENDKQSNTLVKCICEIVIEKGTCNDAWTILGSAIATAVEYGVHELIERCILTYPDIIGYDSHKGHEFSLFLEAIKHRQERVYNLVYQMSGHKVFAATSHYGKENALHIAGKLAPTHRLEVVTGAALQMQRELQWFQEVENFITRLSYKEAENNEKKTPRMVFTEEHKQLLKEGQQWMKDTASSCTVVAALLVTMAFAAAFTLPGGNQDDGTPMFLNFNTFMLFIVSDAIAFFSSSTSVLMFLGILTSRYAEADFLYALPKRLTIGLISLFISIAATMIAFSLALALMLKHKVTWIAAPLVIATSIPVCLFGLLQFPLLVELVKSTYGRSIFHQQNTRWIH